MSAVLSTIALIYTYADCVKYDEIEQDRYREPATHGEHKLSHATKTDVLTNILIFVMNLSLALVYFYMSQQNQFDPFLWYSLGAQVMISILQGISVTL